MGGGGVIRAAARAAVVGGSHRFPPLADQIAVGGGRWKPSPASAAPPVGEAPAASQIPLVSSSATHPGHVGAAVAPQPVWEVDDWVFANRAEEELLVEPLQPPPRLVFGPVPTLEEAKEATSDLKDAIEKTYFSSPATEYELSRKLAPPCPNDTNTLEGMLCTSIGSSSLVHSPSDSVLQAFSLLQQSSEVQSVVASLASDKEVWNAVMKNEKVVEFYKTHQTKFLSETSVCVKEGEEESTDCILEHFTENSSKPCADGGGIMGFINNIKFRLSNMVTHISSLIQDFLGSPPPAKNQSSSAGGYDTTAYAGASFVALAVGVIMVILFKRV